MFTKNSRYYGLDSVTAKDPNGRQMRAVKLRRLPDTSGQPLTVHDGDRLDVISERLYLDGTRYWHIADANTELEANELVRQAGRDILVPES